MTKFLASSFLSLFAFGFCGHSHLHAGNVITGDGGQGLRNQRPARPPTVPSIDCYEIARTIRRDFESAQRSLRAAPSQPTRWRNTSAQVVDGHRTEVSGVYQAFLNECSSDQRWSIEEGAYDFDAAPGTMRRVPRMPGFLEIVAFNGRRTRFEILSCDATPSVRLRPFYPNYEMDVEYRRAGASLYYLSTYTNLTLDCSRFRSPFGCSEFAGCPGISSLASRPERHWVHWEGYINLNGSDTPDIGPSITARRQRFSGSLQEWIRQNCVHEAVTTSPGADQPSATSSDE